MLLLGKHLPVPSEFSQADKCHPIFSLSPLVLRIIYVCASRAARRKTSPPSLAKGDNWMGNPCCVAGSCWNQTEESWGSSVVRQRRSAFGNPGVGSVKETALHIDSAYFLSSTAFSTPLITASNRTPQFSFSKWMVSLQQHLIET